MMSMVLSIVIPFLSSSLVTTIIMAVVKNHQVSVSNTVVGVIDTIPEELRQCRLVSSFKTAEALPGVVLLRCKNLSFALRKCDFVVANCATDEKLISPDDHELLQCIVNQFSQSCKS